MIVYNVNRRWFAEKAAAEQYRVAEGLRPSATLTLRVEDRNALVALLEALCSPPVPTTQPGAAQSYLGDGLPPPLIDRAYVMTGKDIPDCIPAFLLKAHGIERK